MFVTPLAIATLFVSSLASAHGAPSAIADHFFVRPNADQLFHPRRAPAFRVFSEPTDCRAHIAEVICHVNPSQNDRVARECLQEKDLNPAVAQLQLVHDAFPPVLQRVFCSLDVIYVEKDFIGTAYAGLSDDGRQAVMGIRETALLPEAGQMLSLSEWVSWKEQLSFGGTPMGYSHRDDLVKIDAEIASGEANDFLFFVIAHEFGHVLDFANRVNHFDCEADPARCEPAPGTWSKLSWRSYDHLYPDPPPASDPWALQQYQPLADADFLHRDQLCFYACPAGHGSKQKMEALYLSLQSSTLLTTYSATNPWDDFAEFVAFYAGVQRGPMRYDVLLPSGLRYDLASKFLHDPRLTAKRSWLEEFFERGSIRLP